MNKFFTITGVITLTIVLFIIGILVVMLGWHLFAVPVFGLKELTFLQALGFTLLPIGGSVVRYNHNK